MAFRGPNEAAIAQRLWSLFNELRTLSSDAGRAPVREHFAVELGRRLNTRIAHGPDWLFALPYDATRVRAWAEGEGLSLTASAIDPQASSEPAHLIALWTRLCEGREHSPWALIERWDRSADALAEVASAMQPALFHRWVSISCVDKAELVYRVDEGQRRALDAFARGPVGEYWTELLALEEPLGASIARSLAATPRAFTMERFEGAARLRAAIGERVARRDVGIDAVAIEQALYDSAGIFVAIAFGLRRSPWFEGSAPPARAWWTGAAAELALLDPKGVATIGERLEKAVHCPDLRALVDAARIADTRTSP